MTKAIVATAVGTILAGLTLQLSGLLPKVVSWVWGVASWIVGTLVSSHGIPGWAILTLGLLALFGVITLSMMVIEALRDGQEQPIKEQPFFINYTEDEIDGVIWRWKWADGSIADLWCFCPTCDAQLVYAEAFVETSFICERCPTRGRRPRSGGRGRVVTSIEGGDHQYLVDAAGREILRRVRVKARELPPG